MDVLKEYLLYNWALILTLLAFIIMLIITVFLDKKTVMKMYILIASVFILSIVVFFEFYLGDINEHNGIRVVLTAIRYSSTPIIIALILLTLVKKARWFVLIPAFLLLIINIISIFTGIVFSVDSFGELKRGPLGYLPYIGVGVYSVALVVTLVRQANQQPTEIIPIVFLAFALSTGLIFPFIIGKDYSKIFTTTIAIALFVYYVFLILQLTKKDALTGLLNRQAYYSFISANAKDITAIVSIDMNGLKVINDTMGHQAGDDAISSVASSIQKATKFRETAYRIGGDEFIVICHKIKKEELDNLLIRITNNISNSTYSCSIGYCFNDNDFKNIDEMIKLSDDMMYQDKANYYEKNGLKRRNYEKEA